jgi:hypothetical protein
MVAIVCFHCRLLPHFRSALQGKAAPGVSRHLPPPWHFIVVSLLFFLRALILSSFRGCWVMCRMYSMRGGPRSHQPGLGSLKHSFVLRLGGTLIIIMGNVYVNPRRRLHLWAPSVVFSQCFCNLPPPVEATQLRLLRLEASRNDAC